MKRQPDDRGPWLQTYTGVQFFPLDPRPEDVRLADIAHALALQCRFAGHCRVPYSVAEHSVRVSGIVPGGLALAALLHDAAEAYVTDVTRPVKAALDGALRPIEHRVARAIGERFGVELVPTHPIVKHADNVFLATEARDIMCEPPAGWEMLPEPLGLRVVPWEWQTAEVAFAERFVALGGDA